MIRYDLIVKKVDGCASARVEKHEVGSFVKYFDVMERIAELENQWISVDDEMPSAEHAMVIVDYYGGNVSVGYPHKGKILDEPMGMLFNGVTHWMPLPDPQKEQE